MSGILRLESLTKGNTLKQGDKTPLKYRLFDADGEKLNIAGKSAQVRLVYPDFLTIGYEKDGLTVAQDDTVTFTIDGVIPSRIYHVEIIVDDQFIFPSRSDEAKFTVDKSSLGTETNIIEIVGVDAVVRKAVDLINKDPNLIIDENKLVNDIISNSGIGNINDYYKAFNDLKPKAELSITRSAEALTKSQNALNIANGIDAKATNALSLSKSADTLSKNVQEQFNQVVINGDSSVESAQARVDASGKTNPTLKARLDKEHNEVTMQLAQTDKLSGDAHSKNTVIAPKSPTGKGFIVFVDDDARREVLTKLKPISDEYGIPFTLAVPVRNGETTPDQDLTPEELRGLQAQGWEMASHSYNHIGLHNQPKEVVEFELRESKKVLESWGLNVKNYIAPYGHVEQPLIREIASKYYNSAGRVGGLTNKRPVRNFRLHRVPMGSFQTSEAESTVAFYKAQVDDAFASDGLLIFMTHAHQPEHNATQDSYMRQTIAYAQSLGIPIGNLQEGYERYGNLLEVEGKAFIGMDGKPLGSLIPIPPRPNMVVMGHPGTAKTDIMMATTPETIWGNFRNKIVHVTYASWDNQNFPVSKGGYLITHSMTSIDNMWQEWHPYHSPHDVYYRHVVNNTTWSDFTKDSPLSDNQYVINYPGANPKDIQLDATPRKIIDNYRRKVIETQFSLAHNQDFPVSKAGTLITHAPGFGWDDIWQEWHPYHSPQTVYYRHATSETSWSDFVLS